MSEGFDRVKPRPPREAGQPAVTRRDAQGKRALFSSTSLGTTAGVGSALVECSRCEERTVMTLGKAARAALPSLHLGLRLGHGERVRSVSVFKHDFPTYMRCPACGRPSWVRLTIAI